MERKHSPLPWHVGDGYSVHLPDGELIAEYTSPPDAAFIARACNSHYELVEALEMFITAGHGNSTHFGIQAKAHTLARAALAKAKGEA